MQKKVQVQYICTGCGFGVAAYSRPRKKHAKRKVGAFRAAAANSENLIGHDQISLAESRIVLDRRAQYENGGARLKGWYLVYCWRRDFYLHSNFVFHLSPGHDHDCSCDSKYTSHFQAAWKRLNVEVA